MQPTEEPGKADRERHRDRGIISLLLFRGGVRMDMQAQNRRGKGSANRPIRLSPTQARQGITPHVTRHVLVWGLTLAVLAFALIYYFQL
jgi:hypothetical protein